MRRPYLSLPTAEARIRALKALENNGIVLKIIPLYRIRPDRILSIWYDRRDGLVHASGNLEPKIGSCIPCNGPRHFIRCCKCAPCPPLLSSFLSSYE